MKVFFFSYTEEVMFLLFVFPHSNKKYYSSYCKNSQDTLDPNFVTGLTEAEGCFSVVKLKDSRAKFGTTIGFRFKISMLVNEVKLLEKVHSFFGFGTISINKDGTVDFIVRDFSNIKKIKEHFLKYPLRGSKYLDFLSFVQAIDIFEKNIHRSEEGFNLLKNISESMNSYRKDFTKLPPLNTIKDNPNYIPISGHYINGFIAGDGCLYLKTNKSNFGSMGIQISQHVHNITLMREILDYFDPCLKIYPHGKDSVQIRIGGKKSETTVFQTIFHNILYMGLRVLVWLNYKI